MNEISDEFGTWADWIIRFRIISPRLLKKCHFDSHQHNSFSFVWIFLKLADKVDLDAFLENFESWPDWIINFRVMSP